MSSNFEFIREILPKTYERLAAAEKNVRTNFEIDARRALEELVTEYAKFLGVEWIFDEYGKRINNKYPDITLEAKITVCSSREKLISLGYEYEKRGIVLPKAGGQIKCELVNGKTKEFPVYVFLRKYGNSASHIEKDDHIKLSYEVSIKALSAFHAILAKIYNRLGKGAPIKEEFNESLMPIQGNEHLYYIDEAYVPADASMSKCQMEFKAHFESNGSVAGTEYAIIRQFQKQDADQMRLLRDKDAKRKAEQDDPMGGSPYCVRFSEVLSAIENEKSPFYIVVYHFQEKPQPLSAALMEPLGMKTRLSICADLAHGIADTHRRNIYLRLLTYGNVYICDYSVHGKGIHPHLVKFDFAKIAGGEVYTLLAQAAEAKGQMEFNSIKKYVPDDWEEGNWEKADIYSLGVLLCDILSGAINKNQSRADKAMEKLNEDKQISDELLDFILDGMLCRAAEKRPDAQAVQRMLETELKRWN